jgi:hypothetical protein
MKKVLIIEKNRKSIDRFFKPEEHGWVVFICLGGSEIYSLVRSLEIRYPGGKIVIIMDKNKNPEWKSLLKRDCECKILHPVYPIKTKSLFYRQMKSLEG